VGQSEENRRKEKEKRNENREGKQSKRKGERGLELWEDLAGCEEEE
jgi:hypothetical protein